jgi:hypothetical protein
LLLKTKNKKKIVVVCPSSSSDCFFFRFFSLSEVHFWLLYYCCCYVAKFLFFLFECHQWERGEGIETTDYRGAIVVIVVIVCFFSLEFRRVFCVLVLVTDDELASLCLFFLRCLVR